MDIGTMLNLLVDDYINKMILGYENNLKIILSDEDIDVTEEDDIASLIVKVDEEFDRQNNEISSLNTELVECRDTLKHILIDKNIEGIENENSLSVLISKVNELEGSKVWLYKEGNEYIDKTGGYSKTYSYGTHSFTKDTALNLSGSDYFIINVATKNTFNLTPYKTFKVEVEYVKAATSSSGSHNILRVGFGSSTTASTPSICYAHDWFVDGARTLSLDISSYTSTGYLIIYLCADQLSSSIKIKNMWFE
jgi:hypothetical protein